MRNPIENQYHPDVVSPPSETLTETLEVLGMSLVELAIRTGYPVATINEVLQGRTVLTPELATQFERVLGVPATFWNERERHSRERIEASHDELTCPRFLVSISSPSFPKWKEKRGCCAYEQSSR